MLIDRYLRPAAAAVAAALALLSPCAACSGGERSGAPAPVGAKLVVANASVRACDLLVDTADQATVSVRFGEGVRGKEAQRAPHVAIALMASADRPLARPVAFLERATPAATRIVSASCFDAQGTRVTDPGVHWAAPD